jgi:hypothetical protein
MAEETNLAMSEQEAEAFWNGDFSDAFEQETNADESEELPRQRQEDAGEPAAPAARATSAAQTVRVKYNGQEMQIPLQEATPLIQKGMNYDHVAKELAQLRAAPERQVVKALAQQSGKSVEQYLSDARSALGLPSDGGRAEQFKAFFAQHPNISPAQLPASVLAAVSRGETLETAYAQHENTQLRQYVQQLQTELSQQRQQMRNFMQSVGSVAGSAPPQPVEDEGWAAFMRG